MLSLQWSQYWREMKGGDGQSMLLFRPWVWPGCLMKECTSKERGKQGLAPTKAGMPLFPEGAGRDDEKGNQDRLGAQQPGKHVPGRSLSNQPKLSSSPSLPPPEVVGNQSRVGPILRETSELCQPPKASPFTRTPSQFNLPSSPC